MCGDARIVEFLCQAAPDVYEKIFLANTTKASPVKNVW